MSKTFVPHGSNTHNLGKLKLEDVREIKKRIANGETLVSIAKDYSVTANTISFIKRGITWKDV